MVNTRRLDRINAGAHAMPGAGPAAGDPEIHAMEENIVRSRNRIAASPLTAALTFALCAAFAAPALAADWKPTRPINLIVPGAAGGSTDQVTRATAAELEPVLGQKIVVVNQPGASGSLGTKSALEAPKDGYTWTAGAAQDLGAYETLALLKTRITDWNLFLNVANVSVISVNANSPYKTVKELLDAMKAKPGEISVATAGVTSAGHNAMEAVAKVTGVKYKHVTYDGGNPAVVATVAGETQVTTQLAVEEADMIRGKRLRPLAVVGDKPLELEGYGTIPPLSASVPGFTAPVNYFGIFVPKGVPPEVIETLDKAWKTTIANSAALRKYASSRGALFTPIDGEAAQKAVFPAVQANAWLMFDTHKATISPDTVGIPKP
jgi:tripartite-type tricarboxylate transporter receptor subunit TctC